MNKNIFHESVSGLQSAGDHDIRASVSGYVGDSETVLLTISAQQITSMMHFSPAGARKAASLIIAAADAIEALKVAA